MTTDLANRLRRIVQRYDLQKQSAMEAFLDLPGDLWSRRTVPVHVTGSAVPISPSGSAVAMVHHLALKRWLQPGGHLDPGELPHEAAVRECFEETGLTITLADDCVPDAIDLHRIPPNPAKGEAEHFHLDFKYVAVASGTLRAELTEVASARWFDPDPTLLQDERVIAAISAVRAS